MEEDEQRMMAGGGGGTCWTTKRIAQGLLLLAVIGTIEWSQSLRQRQGNSSSFDMTLRGNHTTSPDDQADIAIPADPLESETDGSTTTTSGQQQQPSSDTKDAASASLNEISKSEPPVHVVGELPINCSSIDPNRYENISEPPFIKLVQHQAFFLHIGKAGGGGISSRMGNWWKLKLFPCHPNPQPCARTLMNHARDFTTMVIAIRDPVDRFLSAWYWRMMKFRNTKDQRAKEEKRVFIDTYHENANLLAEALCSESSSEQTRAAAAADMEVVGHSRYTIADWLGGRRDETWHDHVRDPRLAPVVVEHNHSLEAQVDAVMQHIGYTSSHSDDADAFFEDEASFAARQDYAQWFECHGQYKQSKKFLEKQEARKHSSTQNAKLAPLSELGTKCVARYYAEDYEILRAMAESEVCRSDLCQSALESILARREHLLLPPTTRTGDNDEG